MNREQIKEQALANGFKLKPQSDGSEDLNPYVYEFAKALDSAATAGRLMLEKGQKLAAENSPEAIESEREANAVLTAENERLQAEVERLRETEKKLRVINHSLKDDHAIYFSRNLGLEQERDQLKDAVALAVDAFKRYEMDVETYPNIEHVSMMRNLEGVLAVHEAELIERETQRCIEAVEVEPEYPGEAPPELMKLIGQCIENNDAGHILHMMRHSVRLTKSEIINRIRRLPTQQAKVQPVNDSCQMECGAYGTYCRCRAEKAEEV